MSGQDLRAARTRLGLSQPEAGALVSPSEPVSAETWSRWESGSIRWGSRAECALRLLTLLAAAPDEMPDIAGEWLHELIG